MDEEFPLRLYWLSQGEMISGPIPEWVLVWHYRRFPSQELVAAHHASPQRRALTIQRHHPRFRRDLEECFRCLREASHPQLRLVWCLQLLQHEAQADILRVLSKPELDQDLVGALTWTLAQYGRDIVLLIEDLFPAALKIVRDRYCQALWYLGKQARGCERWLQTHDTPWSRAVLYRLEEWGTALLLKWRAAPLYLDRATLDALAAMAFSLNEGERWYAINAFLGWGPALPQAAELLESLALDRDPDYARAALLSMRRLNFRPELKTLRSLLLKGPDQISKLALEIYFQGVSAIDLPTVHEALEAIQSEPGQPLQSLLSELEPDLLVKALQLLGQPGPTTETTRYFVRQVLAQGKGRAAAARALLQVGGSTRELLPYLKEPEVAELVVQSAPPELLLELVQHRQIRRQIRTSHKLLHALISWPPPSFQKLLDLLAEIEPALLEELELQSIQWSRYADFNEIQREIAVALIHLHRTFPRELAEELCRGRLNQAGPLRLLALYAPPDEAPHWLTEIYANAGSSASYEAVLELRKLGEVGWRAFSLLLEHPRLEVARAALARLSGWAPPAELIRRPCRSELQAALADGAALELLPYYGEVTPERVELALQLLPLVKSMLPRVSGYLERSQPSEQLLELYPQYPHLRRHILQWLRLWRPPQIAGRVRLLAQDSQPELVLLRLQLLHELEGLNPVEVRQLDSMEGEEPELRMLKLSYPEGPHPDP